MDLHGRSLTLTSLVLQSDVNTARGDYAAGGRSGEENPSEYWESDEFGSLDTGSTCLYCPPLYGIQVSNPAHALGFFDFAGGREAGKPTGIPMAIPASGCKPLLSACKYNNCWFF